MFSAELVNCNREKELLAKQLHIQSSKAAAYKQQATDLSAAMTSGVRVLMQNNIALRKEQTKVRESKVGLQQRYKELRKSSVPRNIHEKVLKEVSEQNKQLQQDVGSLSLQIEARDVENERSGEKVLALQKKVNRLRMLSARKDISMEHNKLAADVALNELRLDKEASETYHQHILQLLQQEVEMGIKTEEDLQQEIQAMKSLETKCNGIFNAQVRLLYYDLLGKGVSANIIHNVVKTVLQHATPIDADSVSLPSRSTAQRMVLEAGELVKVRTSYELLNNNGNLGHHSDGTTKSLIHWGMHVLKLDCGDKTKTFSLTVSPVPSGKAADTVNQLIEQMAELEQIAHDMGTDPGDAFSLKRVVSRMSDRANNEWAVTKLMKERFSCKKERLRSLISTNAATIDAIVTRGTATVNSTPPSPQQQQDSASEQQSSSEEDLEDTESYHHIQDARLHTFKFTQTSEVVVVAFAGGVWYPGVVKTVVSPNTAIINYLHPTSHTVPLPESTEFRFPAKEDTMETDAASVFENNLTCEPTSTSCRTFTLSQNVSSINTRYAQFARLYNIPL